MALPKEIALSEAELDELMTSTWNLRVASIGPGTRINLTPLWFGWAGGKVFFYCRGQKVVNLRRDPTASVLVDRNERFPELVGAMFQGRAEVLEDAAAEQADADLELARQQMATKYAGGHGESSGPSMIARASARGSKMRWVRFTPERVVTWDNHKL
jgi:nitroimidazol reductase NimA-like FMN-containing flavoprotein (pyridoxamine 5'-phosphate oxidase superfamily)